MRRIALAVGDTVGHVSPALALAREFRLLDGGAEIVFFGTADSLAHRALTGHGEAMIAVPGAPIRRAGARGLPRAVTETTRATIAARGVLHDERVRLVIGFGGFATGGVLVAARTLGLATAIHEANVEPGLANLLLRRLVHRVYTAFDTALPGGLCIGLPIRASIAALASVDPVPPPGPFRVLVTSGSRGIEFFTLRMPAVVRELERLHLNVEIEHVGVTSFVADMAAAYARAHVVIARAGGSTIAELAAAGRPAILVPLGDSAADHQSANARIWAGAGAGLAVAESEWESSRVAEWLARVATTPDAWSACAHAARRLAHPDAARQMAADCDAFMQGRW
jgi:UDP-N-acetylglucosamine--N-acetylmuramyl-(pentapeptide) pyrophosphoryl-undecaprenol N-acetylglucosamine transferase